MASQTIEVVIPAMSSETLPGGSIRFRASNRAGGFEATFDPAASMMVADYRHGEDAGNGHYHIDSRDDLAAILGHLLLYAAGLNVKANLIGLAEAASGDDPLRPPSLSDGLPGHIVPHASPMARVPTP